MKLLKVGILDIRSLKVGFAVSVIINAMLLMLWLDSDTVTQVTQEEMAMIVAETEGLPASTIRGQSILVDNDELTIVGMSTGLGVRAMLGGPWRQQLWIHRKRPAGAPE